MHNLTIEKIIEIAGHNQITDNPFCMHVSGTGRLQVYNTGGSSAGDGGMGSGSKDDTEKGDLSAPGEKVSAPATEEEGFDPIKKNVREKERENEANQ